MINRISFGDKSESTNLLSSYLENKKHQDKPFFVNKKKLLTAGLGALALGGMVFVAINKIKRPKKIIETAGQISPQSVLKYAEEFENFFRKYDKASQNVIAKQSSLKNETMAEYIDSAKDFDIFRKVFEINNKSKVFSYPQIVGFRNTDSQTAALFTEMLAKEYKWGFGKRKYDSSYLNEFIEMLRKESETEKNPRFIFIENFKHLKSDADKGSAEYRDIMRAIFKNNQKNNIIYITNDTEMSELNDLTFIFKDNTNSLYDSIRNKVEKFDLEECMQTIHDSAQNTSAFLNNESGEFFKSFFKKDFRKPVILTKNSDEKYLESFVEEVNKYEKARLVQFDCNEKADLKNCLLNELEKHNTHFNLYGEKTYLHITNLEKYLDTNIVNILNNAEKDFNIMPMIEYKDASEVLKSFDSNYDFIFSRKFVYTDKLAAQIAKRAENNDLSHIEPKSFQYILNSFVQPDFENGIILQGKPETAEVIIKSLVNIFDMNYKKIIFDKENIADNMKVLLKASTQAKKDFELTGKRTFIELGNIDELLTNFSTVENRRQIAAFKNFSENCAKNYNTTLIFHTTKDLDDFEPASIAPHRFGLKINLI